MNPDCDFNKFICGVTWTRRFLHSPFASGSEFTGLDLARGWSCTNTARMKSHSRTKGKISLPALTK